MTRKEFFLAKREETQLHSKEPEDFYDKEINELVFQIIKVRKSQNMTQKELAEKVGVSKNTISRIEMLSNQPSLKMILKICKVLGLTLKIE